MGKFDKRIEFLADKFNVYMVDEVKSITNDLEKDGYVVDSIVNDKDSDVNIGLVYYLEADDDNTKIKKFSMIHEDIFYNMFESDPTKNKIYLQWMLNIFSKLLKKDDTSEAIMFGCEDLPLAKKYLEVFDNNKRKKLFSKLSKSNYALKGLKDPSNINQYSSLSQLFDAVDPFIEKNPSDLERLMERFVESGSAEIPVKDRRFTLYIPKTTDASVIFDKFAGWCTAKTGNSMFNRYTNNKTPLLNKSNIYIIIDNKFLNGDYNDYSELPNDVLCQIHFETKQVMDRSNKSYTKLYDNFISKSIGLSNYFYEKLKPLASAFVGSLKSNYYIDYLISFGFSDILFDLVDDDSPAIMFKDGFIPTTPDLSRFRNLEYLLLGNVKLESLDNSIFDLPNLTILSIPDNNIKSLPKNIGYCKSLVFMNLVKNKIDDIPEEISKLDKSNGGKLHRISVRESDLGSDNYNRLKELLPSVVITEDI